MASRLVHIKGVPMYIFEEYYNVVDCWGEEQDIECDTHEDAVEWMREKFIAHVEDNQPRKFETYEYDFHVLRKVIRDDGEELTIKKTKEVIKYTPENTDFEEHNTIGR